MEKVKEQWASGKFTDLHRYGAAILNAKAIGACESYGRVLDLTGTDFDDAKEMLEDE